MKIKNVRRARKLLAFAMSVEMLTTQYYIPPYRMEESFELEQPIFGDSKGVSRKLSKKKNNPSFSGINYSRNARNSLSKPNYYGKPRDF